MDWLIVALIAGLAFWVGSAFGFRNGFQYGAADAELRRRLAELGKPR